MFSRQELELVIQKKKLDEVYTWFHEHFLKCDHAQYTSRRPLVIFQGPTGSGKSTTLRWISQELGIPLKEFTETTDLTSINTELMSKLDGRHPQIVSHEKRKAQRFEQFVKNLILFKPVVSCLEESNTSKNNGKKSNSGVIIHIETPLTFTSNQQLTIHTLCRLLKIVKELSMQTPRRVAIVFETIEGDNNETLMISGKMKLTLGFQIFKFNPITKANIKKLIDNYVKSLNQSIELEKKTVDQLVEDSNGDMTACVRTLQLLCNNNQNDRAIQDGLTNGTNVSTMDSGRYTMSNGVYMDENQSWRPSLPPIKRQKLNHSKLKKITLDSSLMRDTTQSANYFHILGKILYQKRYYPPMENIKQSELSYLVNHSSLMRPFERENNTDTLLNMLDVEPRNLITWLHQHYPRFCSTYNIARADSFLESLSDTDLLSLNSAQTTQFYEQHNTIDQIQAHVAIESTIFSLYQNKMVEMKNSYKKVTLANGRPGILKPSVENNVALESNGMESFYSFTKPVSIEVQNLSKNYSKLVATTLEKSGKLLDATKLVVEYLPYLRLIGRNKQMIPPAKDAKYYDGQCRAHPEDSVFLDETLLESYELLDDFIEAGLSLEKIEKKMEKVISLIENLEFVGD